MCKLQTDELIKGLGIANNGGKRVPDMWTTESKAFWMGMLHIKFFV